MIGRIEVDLTAAIAQSAAVSRNINGATWIRFMRVPAAVAVRLETTGGDRIPVEQPYTMKICGEPVTRIFVDNDGVAGSGSLVIVYGDDEVELDDFLASAAESGGDWRTVFMARPTSGGFMNILDPAQNVAQYTVTGTNVAVMDVPNQRFTMRAGVAAAATQHGANAQSRDLASIFLNLFGQVGVRHRTEMPHVRVEHEVFTELAGAGAKAIAAGMIAANAATIGNLGVGWFVSPTVTGNNNWWYGVLNAHGGGVWPLLADRIIWRDSGLDSTTALRHLRVQFGADGGIPHIIWAHNGVEIWRHTGALPSWPTNWPNTPFGIAHSVQKAVAGDTGFLHCSMARISHKFIYAD